MHREYALLADVIRQLGAQRSMTFRISLEVLCPAMESFPAWSYRAGAGRAEAFLLNPRPLSARTAYDWGVVTEVVRDGEALSRALELAYLYLKVPQVTRRNTRIHFTQPLKRRNVREVGYGLSLEGASAADLVKSMQAATKG